MIGQKSYYKKPFVYLDLYMQLQAIVDVFGDKATLGRPINSLLDFADAIEAGLPRRAAQQIKQHLELTEQELASSLGVSTKTLQRKAKQTDAVLTPSQGDRLYRLARLVAFAEHVFEDQKRARQWLREPQLGLGNRIPLELMHSEAGAQEVEDLLGRLEYGVFS